MNSPLLRLARTACCRALVLGALLTSLVPLLRADFGVNSVSGRYEVDTGAGLVFQVNQANGDIVSILFAGKQLQDPTKFSHIASGLGAATVTATTYDDAIKIACETATLTHYYVARRGENTIYMATYTTQEPSVGELRYIARLNRANLPYGPRESDILGGTAIEGSDVFLVGGETRSKFYSSVPFIEDQVHGVTGDGVGAYMVIPGNGYEASSGGPFFRDIDNQGSSQQEVYFYMNSGHLQTEAYRMGLHGPYALCFTAGEAPSGSLDTGFMKNLGLLGYVPVEDRGTIHGKVTGIPDGFPAVVGFANSTAQYWTYAHPVTGVYKKQHMIPGTYTMTLYKFELAVATTTVTIPNRGAVKQDLASAEVVPDALWRIGEWDGTPAGFLNADKIERMHPSDTRMSPWAPGAPFVVGVSADNTFPMAQFKDVNNPLYVQFELAPDQVTDHVLRIGITSSFNGGRPQVSVNPGTANAWNGPNPPAPTKINSRGVTRGTYRGLNQTFTVTIPASALVAGTNTLRITAISGTAGTGFLSPNYVFDAIELDR